MKNKFVRKSKSKGLQCIMYCVFSQEDANWFVRQQKNFFRNDDTCKKYERDDRAFFTGMYREIREFCVERRAKKVKVFAQSASSVFSFFRAESFCPNSDLA